jgi:hypothetical protein
MLVNINKLKPYRFIEDKTLQPVLVKPGDLVTDELVQTKEHVPLLVELEDFQPVGFKLVSNHLTPGIIKITDVLGHHYDNLPIWDNNVVVSNDVFKKAPIDVYLLGVSKLKGYVYSQPQNHFCMKQYKELFLHFSFGLFIFIFFFMVARAMSESALERLRREAREEVEIKAEAFRREHIKKKRAEEVQLIGAIYVEPLATRAPTSEEIKKNLNKNREVGN